VTWTLALTSEQDSDGFTNLVGVGDDEVVLRSETFVEPPEELFAFDLEGRFPTPEEEEALDAWFFENQESAVTWTVIPVG